MPADFSKDRPGNPQLETTVGMLISLGFWCCLLISAALFGSVALAPKIQACMQLRVQYETNQGELVSLERQASRLQRVIDAIRNDKQFASEMTRIELDAVQPGEEVIPVPSELKLNSDVSTIDAPRATRTVWYNAWIQEIAAESRLRTVILCVAASLVVVGFTVLQPQELRRSTPELQGGVTIWQTVKGRYAQRH